MKYFLILTLMGFNAYGSEDQELLKIVKKYGKGLKSELKKGLKISPVNAIDACNTKAPQIERKLSQDKIKIGRVSIKNRNPNNKVRPWMSKAIKQYHSKKTKSPYIKVDINENKIGILKPILTSNICLTCHGKEIEAKLSEKIKVLYPNDKAVGYSVGDIRGFFWITKDKNQ